MTHPKFYLERVKTVGMTPTQIINIFRKAVEKFETENSPSTEEERYSNRHDWKGIYYGFAGQYVDCYFLSSSCAKVEENSISHLRSCYTNLVDVLEYLYQNGTDLGEL